MQALPLLPCTGYRRFGIRSRARSREAEDSWHPVLRGKVNNDKRSGQYIMVRSPDLHAGVESGFNIPLNKNYQTLRDSRGRRKTLHRNGDLFLKFKGDSISWRPCANPTRHRCSPHLPRMRDRVEQQHGVLHVEGTVKGAIPSGPWTQPAVCGEDQDRQ